MTPQASPGLPRTDRPEQGAGEDDDNELAGSGVSAENTTIFGSKNSTSVTADPASRYKFRDDFLTGP
jgi:hypothetical protein